MEDSVIERDTRSGESDVAIQQRARVTGAAIEVTPDVACLPLSLVNLYFYGRAGAPDRFWVMIDAGLGWSKERILRAATDRFGRGSRPAAILLTHGHFDHVGTLPNLADYWDAPIYAHELEMPYLTGQSSYPPPDPAVGGGAMSFLSRLYPREPIDLGNRVRSLPADGSVPGMAGWRWVHTPGHAPGHVSFFRETDRTLIVGDAFVTQRQESAWAVLTMPQEVRRPPAYFTPDWETARHSVEILARLRPDIVATGHGVPMFGERMREQLDALVRDWDQVAVPRHGRYVRRPAIADERGVVSVPPPVSDPQLKLVAGLGLAALVGILLFRKRSSSSRRA